MHRVAVVAAAAAVLLALTVPAQADPSGTPTSPAVLNLLAEDAVVEPSPARDDGPAVGCANDDRLDVVALDGSPLDSASAVIATPAFDGLGEEATSVLVDLAESSTDALTAVDITLSWEDRSNDFDLVASVDDVKVRSEAYQPVEEPTESIRVDVRHCQVVDVTVVNFLAPGDDDQLTLSFARAEVAQPALTGPEVTEPDVTEPDTEESDEGPDADGQ